MPAFLSNIAHRQTDRQTDKRMQACGQKHIPPPLSEVNNICIYKETVSAMKAKYEVLTEKCIELENFHTKNNL